MPWSRSLHFLPRLLFARWLMSPWTRRLCLSAAIFNFGLWLFFRIWPQPVFLPTCLQQYFFLCALGCIFAFCLWLYFVSLASSSISGFLPPAVFLFFCPQLYFCFLASGCTLFCCPPAVFLFFCSQLYSCFLASGCILFCWPPSCIFDFHHFRTSVEP